MKPFDLAAVSEAMVRGVLAPEQWCDSLQLIAKLTGSAAAVLLPLEGDPPILAPPCMDEILQLYINDGWHSRDERYLARPAAMKRGVATDDDVMSKELRQRSPFYQDFLKRFHLDEWAGVRVGRGSLIWILSLQRSSFHGAYSSSELDCLGALSNSLDTIAQVSSALNLARGEVALDAFQFSGHAALLFDRSGRVVRVNAMAESLIQDDVQISGGLIRSWDKHATERLDRALAELFWKPRNSIVKPVVFPRLSGGKIVFYPMRIPASLDSPLAAFHAIMVIGETGAQRKFSPSTLQTVFDLTPAEARLAIAIGSGGDLSTYAAQLGLSKETVRNQLKAVFAKVRVTRQADLAATIASLIPDGS